MYLPTSEEKKKCIDIVREVKKIQDESLCEKYADKVLNIAYSIGGSYKDVNVLRKIAEVTQLKDE